MGFLDNSGDIILDAVLTDTGRMRLAQGDGTFKIAKFALGDDEINYSLYNSAHASGSAYYDLSIMQTPVLEAFTNNASSLKSKLITITKTSHEYLPVLKLNELDNDTRQHSIGAFLVAVDQDTELDLAVTNSAGLDGLIFGENTGKGNHFRVDQGIDNTVFSFKKTLKSQAPDLYESAYIIEMDNRLCTLANTAGASWTPNFIDDDNIASYYVKEGTAFVNENNNTNNDQTEVIAGARGSTLRFKLVSSLNLNNDTYYFDLLGSAIQFSTLNGASTATGKHIDTTVRVTGFNTGYSIDIPVRFVKKD